MADRKTYEEYKAFRRPHYSPYNDRRLVYFTTARQALERVRGTRRCIADKARFEALGGYVEYEFDACEAPTKNQPGRLRVVKCPDDFYRTEDDLFGETYNPDVHPEIKPQILKKELKAAWDQVEQEGVWGYKSEFWDGENWIEGDSCWGFIGEDDIELMEFMDSAMEGYAACLQQEARDYEATRPDIYQKRRDLAATCFAAAMLGV